jgi:hypothetical protein
MLPGLWDDLPEAYPSMPTRLTKLGISLSATGSAQPVRLPSLTSKYGPGTRLRRVHERVQPVGDQATSVLSNGKRPLNFDRERWATSRRHDTTTTNSRLTASRDGLCQLEGGVVWPPVSGPDGSSSCLNGTGSMALSRRPTACGLVTMLNRVCTRTPVAGRRRRQLHAGIHDVRVRSVGREPPRRGEQRQSAVPS